MKKNGFTLLEILIALSVFAIIAVITSTALYTIFNSRQRLNQQAERLSQLQIVIALLERDLSQMISRPIIDTHGQRQLPFIGEPQRISFTHSGLINPLATGKRSNLQRVSFYIKEHQLIQQTWQQLDAPPRAKPLEKILLPKVDSITFSFLDAENKSYAIWPSKEIKQPLPTAVQINLSLQNWGKMSLLIK